MRISRKGGAAIIFATNIGLEVTFVTGMVSGPTFRRIFELSDTQLGVALGAASVGMLLASPMAGYNTHRRGPFNTLISGLGVLLFGISLIILANGFMPLLTGLAVTGVAAALIANANSTYLAEWFPYKLRRIMSLSAGIWFASSALSAPGIGAWLQFARDRDMGAWGYRLPYGMDILILLVCMSLGIAFLKAPGGSKNRKSKKMESQEQPQAAPVSAPKSLEWIWIPILGIFHGLLIMVFMAWANPMAQAKFDVSEFRGSLVLGMFAAGLGIGRILLFFFKPDIDERLILTVSGIAGGIFIALGLLAPSYTIALVAIGLGGFVGSATFPCILSLVGTRFPLSRAKVYGYMHSSVALAGLTGPPAVGALADAGIPVYHALLVTPTSGLILAILSFIWMRTRPSRTVEGI